MEFYKPTITRNDMEAVLMSMADEAVGPGERMKTFKKELSHFLSFKNAICLRSFTNGVIYMMRSLGIKKNDRVLISVFANSIYKDIAKLMDIELVECDVNIQNGVMDIDSVKEDVDAALICDCYLRLPDVSNLRKKGVKIMYDLSDYVGCDFDSSLADIAIVSLEDDKLISAAGGSCVMSSRVKLLEPLREETLSDLNAAFSLRQLNSYNFYLKKRKKIREAYIQAVEISPNKIFSFHSEEGSDNAFRFAVYLDNFKECEDFFKRNKIPVRHSFDNTIYSLNPDRKLFKNASSLWPKVFDIPFYYYLKADDIALISKVLKVLP